MNRLISVLVPVFNVELFLDKCIQSVLAQTYSNYELILVDDGSQDRSGSICDSYAQQSPKIKVFHKSNQGQLQSRIYAINQACGEIIVYLDSDDMLKPHALQRINDEFDRTECDCVIYGLERRDKDKILYIVQDKIDLLTSDKRLIFQKMLLENNGNAVVRKAFRRTIVSNVDYSDYYSIHFGEDLLQSLEILMNSKTVSYISDVLYVYQVNSNSVTQRKAYDTFEINFTVLRIVFELLENERLFTPEDFEKYRTKCIDMLVNQLCDIGKLEAPIQKKSNLINRIFYDDFYTKYLKGGVTSFKKKDVRYWIYQLFAMHMNYTLIIGIYCAFQAKSFFSEFKKK